MEHNIFMYLCFHLILCQLICARSSKYSICVKWINKWEYELASKGVNMSEYILCGQFCQHLLILIYSFGMTLDVSKLCFSHRVTQI